VVEPAVALVVGQTLARPPEAVVEPLGQVEQQPLLAQRSRDSELLHFLVLVVRALNRGPSNSVHVLIDLQRARALSNGHAVRSLIQSTQNGRDSRAVERQGGQPLPQWHVAAAP